MTREEAIEVIKEVRFDINTKINGTTRFSQALEMAIKALEQEPTTKNDLGVDREDAVERLNAIKQFIGYDKDSEIVKATQKSLDMAIKALEHPEKNVIAVVPCGDAISRSDVLKLMQDNWHTHNGDWAMQESMDDIRALPSVTPQEPQTFEWCDTCKEYDQEKHCCHRWTKVIRNTVEEMKQEYIGREVLDKIRAEIERQEKWLMVAGYNQYNVDIALDAIKSVVDKYKAETETAE